MVSLPEVNYSEIWAREAEGFCGLIRIPSVYDASSAGPGMPYGRGPRAALDYMRTVMEREGFAVRDYDGAAISVSWGEGAGERVDIVSHLDVVGVDDGWTDNPFSGIRRDGCIWGRGTQDMKSGAWLTWLALKLMKQSGLTPRRELRLVLGSDEERTMDDMRLYVAREGLPAFSFTPDGRFPIINGEKGALMWTLTGAYAGKIRSLRCGIQPNIIPSMAEAELCGCTGEQARQLAETLGIRAETEIIPGGLRLRVHGKGAHASRPEEGHSAAADMLRLLEGLTGEELTARLAGFFSDPYGAGAGMERDIAPMGRLTLNPGVLNIENGQLSAMVDCRYPRGVDSAELTAVFRSRFPELRVELPYDDPPSYVPEDDPYVMLLKQAYTETTGEEARTGISGGVSYSKVFGRCVNFGAVGEHSESLAHQRDERITEADCIAALEIYHRTLIKLAEAEL